MSFWQIIGAAWRGCFEAMRRNPAVFALVFVAFYASDELFRLFAPVMQHGPAVHSHAPRSTPAGSALGLLKDVIDSIIAAPLMLAVHRHVLLDERPALLSNPGRLVYFALYLLAVRLLVEVPGHAEDIVQPDSAAQITLLLISIAAMIVTVRLVLTYPAAALEQYAPIRESWERSRGHWWYITSVMFCGWLPLMIAAVIALAAFHPARQPHVYAGPIFSLISNAISVVFIAFGAAVLSELYRKFGEVKEYRPYIGVKNRDAATNPGVWIGILVTFCASVLPKSAGNEMEIVILTLCGAFFVFVVGYLTYLRLKGKNPRR